MTPPHVRGRGCYGIACNTSAASAAPITQDSEASRRRRGRPTLEVIICKHRCPFAAKRGRPTPSMIRVRSPRYGRPVLTIRVLADHSRPSRLPPCGGSETGDTAQNQKPVQPARLPLKRASQRSRLHCDLRRAQIVLGDDVCMMATSAGRWSSGRHPLLIMRHAAVLSRRMLRGNPDRHQRKTDAYKTATTTTTETSAVRPL